MKKSTFTSAIASKQQMPKDYILQSILNRTSIFRHDVEATEPFLREQIQRSRFLVIGAAGSIGQAVTLEIFARQPAVLHAVDISENNLVELVRKIRSSLGYISGDFRTFAVDCGSIEFDALIKEEAPYDYVLNLSALKHVRSEKDPYTLMRLSQCNILNAVKLARLAISWKNTKYFCVSSDKATNPVNMMGASKRIMELFLFGCSESNKVSLARFANVAFSDGSLLHGFNQRMGNRHPISAPRSISRYFMTPKEAGELCLLSCLAGNNREIFFPKPSDEIRPLTLSSIARDFVQMMGYQPHECASEEEARARVEELAQQGQWPCYFFNSDTSGEKDSEEFHTDAENVDYTRFDSIGVIHTPDLHQTDSLDHFEQQLESMRASGTWSRTDLVKLYMSVLSNFNHLDTGKDLDQRM